MKDFENNSDQNNNLSKLYFFFDLKAHWDYEEIRKGRQCISGVAWQRFSEFSSILNEIFEHLSASSSHCTFI